MLVRWAKQCLQNSCAAQSRWWFSVVIEGCKSPCFLQTRCYLRANICSGCLLHPEAWQQFQAILLLLLANLVGLKGCYNWLLMWEILEWAEAHEKSSTLELEIFLWSCDWSFLYMLSSLFSTAVAFFFYPVVIAASSSVVLVVSFLNKEESVLLGGEKVLSSIRGR